MRFIFVLFFLSFFNSSFGQFSQREKGILAIVKKQDSIPRNIFLDSASIGNLKVWKANTKQVWSSTNRVEKHIEQLYDIRLKFKNHDSAMAFHEEYKKENAEFAPEIKKHKINSDGASNFRVFEGA